MTLAELRDVELDDRAYCLLVAAARASRPRMSPRVALERLAVAIDADRREVAKLGCSRCETVTLHRHERDVADELAGVETRIWRCVACTTERQSGARCLRCADVCRCEPRAA